MATFREVFLERRVQRGASIKPITPIKPISPVIKIQHDQEKKELSHLNDRLSIYIDRIKFLEGVNKQLLAELGAVRNSWGQETRNFIKKMEPELLRSRAQVDTLSHDAAKAAIQSKRANYELESLHKHYDVEIAASNDDRIKMKSLASLLEQNRNELESLKNQINEKHSNIAKGKRENERLNSELLNLSKNLDSEILNCLQLRNENQTLEEQIPFLNAIHEQEVAEMKCLSSGAILNQAQFYHNELERAIRDIRSDFEKLNEVEKQELDAWYKIKTEEITQVVLKRDAMDTEIHSVVHQNKNLRGSLNDQNNELTDSQKKQYDLQNKLKHLQDKLDDLKRSNTANIDQKEREIAALKNKCQELLNDYDQLLHNKTVVEFEINTYRRLLDSSKVPEVPRGEISRDELLERLKREGAKTGDVRISFAWDNVNDLDLHVIEPSGEEISFKNRKSASGGELDIDRNVGLQRSDKPVENIVWPEGNAPRGHYKVLVVYFSNHGGQDPTNYLVLAEFYGKRKEFRGKMTYGDKPAVWEFNA